ncbi:MgtC/SapB family protein [Bacillus horti]|uniref:Mg2+ transporter-C (MgtC) family protein n=1 Tax=Caldalkalibacillus horti TaxID=77523 RepID=A0ABT9VYF3_9BACI|nr:MgtC/SapB family protein [Bacillus horti]MDQ0166028.1 putative Mg2+ transporter-C (MgtC) family protein [Bacillus horti]
MEWLQDAWQAFTGTHYYEITIRLLLATFLGGLVGIEREQNNHPAGFRTHILVCVGSTLIMLISMYGFEEFIYNNPQINTIQDPARLAAQVVSGIGFLGAGTILVHGGTIRGLTTAASLWVVAGIGLALGTGFYYGAALATVLVLVSLVVLNKIEEAFIRKGKSQLIQITVKDSPGKLGEIATKIGDRKISIRRLSIEEGKEQEGYVKLTVDVRLPNKAILFQIVDELRQIDGITDVSIGK